MIRLVFRIAMRVHYPTSVHGSVELGVAQNLLLVTDAIQLSARYPTPPSRGVPCYPVKDSVCLSLEPSKILYKSALHIRHRVPLVPNT
jgi:hypothetical protein